MTLFLAWFRRLERLIERRGEAKYDPDKDPDIRRIRVQRKLSERTRKRLSPIEDLVFPPKRGNQ